MADAWLDDLLGPNSNHPAAPAQQPLAAPAQAGPAWLEDLLGPKTPADAVAGPNGLMWNHAGGYDPKTGELVVAGKPFSNPTDNHPIASKIVAGTEGVLNGVPVVGPTLADLPLRAVAASPRIHGPDGQAYDELKSAVESSQSEHPALTMAGNVAGAVAGTIPLAGTALGARGLGLVGTLPARVIQGAAGGAGLGAADAYMRGDSPTTGAVAGAGLGAVAPAGGSAVGALGRGAMNLLPTGISGPLGELGATARNMLTTAMQGETPASVDAAHAALGPNGFLGDLNNPLTMLTKSVHDKPDAAAGAIKAAYNARAAADGGRIESAITGALGPRQDLSALTRNDRLAQSAAADPLYLAWRNTQVPPTDELRSLMPRLNAAGVSGSAANKMAVSGTPGYNQWFKINPATGQMTLDTELSPTAQTWDYMKQALDDKISNAIRSGERGNARLYQGLKADLVSAIDNHPDPNVAGIWKSARQAWADPQAIINARELGADTLKNSTTVDELREQWGHLSSPEQRAAIQGLRGDIANVFGGTKTGDTTIKNRLLAPNAQDKLSFMIGPQRAQELTAALQQEDAIAARTRMVTGGSPTSQNLQAGGLSGPAAIPGQISNYARNFEFNKPSTWFNANPSNLISEHEAEQLARARQQLAPILTTPNGANADMAHALLGMGRITDARAARAAQLGNMATILLQGAGRQPARDYLQSKGWMQ